MVVKPCFIGVNKVDTARGHSPIVVCPVSTVLDTLDTRWTLELRGCVHVKPLGE